MNFRQDVMDELSEAKLHLFGFDGIHLYNIIEATFGRSNVGVAHSMAVECRG